MNSTNNNGENIKSVSRRKLLATIGAAGFTATGVADVDASGTINPEGDETEIVYGFSRSDPEDMSTYTERTKMVPSDWYVQFKRACEVHKNINLIQRDAVKAIWVVAGDYGGDNSHIRVEVEKDSPDIKGDIPEWINDIRVDVEDWTDGGSAAGDCSDNSNDFGSSPPGGVKCSGPDKYGTLQSALYDVSSYTSYFTTAKHLFNGRGSDVTDDYLYQPSGGQPIGNIFETHCYDDFIVADSINGHSPVSEVTDAIPNIVSGQFSADGLADLKAQGDSLHKVGVTTCKTSGKIKAIHGQTAVYGCQPKAGQVCWGTVNDIDNGDSGGPVYHPDPNHPTQYIMISSYCNGWANNPGYTFGTGAYRIKDRWDYTF